jgi:hypothetical protein
MAFELSWMNSTGDNGAYNVVNLHIS